MGQIGSTVLAKLQRMFPNQIGDNKQWSTSYITALTLAAAHAADERIEMTWVTEEISMTDGTNGYALDSKFITVGAVEFALDGSTYDQDLHPIVHGDLDRLSRTWRDDTGVLPEYYALENTPGTQFDTGNIHLLIWRPLATAGSATIRVGGWGIGTASNNVPEQIIESVHVPYIASVLRAEHDVKEAWRHYKKFVKSCDLVKGKKVSPYAETPVKLGGFW